MKKPKVSRATRNAIARGRAIADHEKLLATQIKRCETLIAEPRLGALLSYALCSLTHDVREEIIGRLEVRTGVS